MVDVFRTFYDKKCNIYKRTVISIDETPNVAKEIVYDNLSCEHYIAPRGNVVNWLPTPESRETDNERRDLVIAGPRYDITRPIEKGMFVELIGIEYEFIIDQVDIYRMPNGMIESVYVRLNNLLVGEA